MNAVKTWFEALADAVCVPVAERVMLSLASEQSDFVRFNRGRVRQMTRVSQHRATVTVVQGQRRIAGSASVSGELAPDVALLLGLRDALARDLPMVPPDPHLSLPAQVVNSCRDEEAHDRLPPVASVVAQVVELAEGLDLVGFYAAGPVIAAFADSRGQRNWHRVQSFHFDWSLYGSSDPAVRDRAVKSIYAGPCWDVEQLRHRMELARARLRLLERPAHAVSPGTYRVWLEPPAVAEILETLAWGGFGIKARRTGTSPLVALENGEAALSAQFQLSEATAGGIAPAFTSSGHVKPDGVTLVAGGRSEQALVSPRSAVEFGLAANADEGEHPASLSLAGGTIDPAAALSALDTGLWIGNLWYLGYSDRRHCRMTGMTRFASFKVERGEIVAPIGVMRFDDSFLRLFGDGLMGLSRQVELLPSTDTYGQRHLGSITAPGALLADMHFTL